MVLGVVVVVLFGDRVVLELLLQLEAVLHLVVMELEGEVLELKPLILQKIILAEVALRRGWNTVRTALAGPWLPGMWFMWRPTTAGA